MLMDSGQVVEEQIGDIRTMDNYSFINIDPAAEETAIQVLGSSEYKGRLLTVNRAKKKDDPAPQD
jgi:ATP-dependent RNA helicase DeaD